MTPVLIIAALALFIAGNLMGLALGWAAKRGDGMVVVDEPHGTDRTRP